MENIKNKFYELKEEKQEIILLTSTEQFYNVQMTGMFLRGLTIQLDLDQARFADVED